MQHVPLVQLMYTVLQADFELHRKCEEEAYAYCQYMHLRKPIRPNLMFAMPLMTLLSVTCLLRKHGEILYIHVLIKDQVLILRV